MPGVKTGAPHDGIALEVKIKVPSNAKSFSYQQNFFTYEYPTFICSTYNDFFVTMMDPQPANLPDGNIAFDRMTEEDLLRGLEGLVPPAETEDEE